MPSPPREARFSADAQAVAVALKLDTPRAVGGLIAPGQRVDVWRIAKAQPPRDLDAADAPGAAGARAWSWCARDLRVLAVRASQGGQVAQPPALGLAGGGESEAAPTSQPGLWNHQRGDGRGLPGVSAGAGAA